MLNKSTGGIIVALAFAVAATAAAEEEYRAADSAPHGSADEAAGSGWSAWRGPHRNGVVPGSRQVPTSWSESENIVWKVPVPGRGHSSPTIVGNRILLTTADERQQTQAVVCFERTTGEQLWLTEVSRGGFPKNIHSKNTHATPSVVSDGERLYAVFHNHGNVQVTALNLGGEQLWQMVAGPYQPRQYEYGYAPSPAVYQSLLIVASEFEQGYLTALDKSSGKVVWHTSRGSNTSYCSPVVAHVAGSDQLLMSGGEKIASYNPLTGKLNWSAPALTSATCGTLVWDEQAVYGSGGYPKAETAAVAADGSGRVLWRNREKCYEQSMLLTEGHLYTVNDSGIAICWRAADGHEMWRARLGGQVSASPISTGGNIYSANERGTVFVFQATPEAFRLVAQNQLGDESFASPAVVDGKLYLRVADSRQGPRQEYLYCIGTK